MIPTKEIRQFVADRTMPSPNKNARRGSGISVIVLHATADGGNEAGAESWMTKDAADVSAHLHIRRDGSLTRHVDDQHRAWHAGVASWKGSKDINSISLGWEIANRNDGSEPYSLQQYITAAELLRHYLPQGIDREDVVSHAQIAPGRKTDPLGWDWELMWSLVDEAPEVPAVTPEVTPARPPVQPPLMLDKIFIPRQEHVAEIVRVKRLAPEVAEAGLEVAEVLLRGVAKGQSLDVKRAIIKAAADAVADWLKARPAA